MIKKLMSCIGEFKKETILTPIFVAFESILDVVIPYLMALLIDNGINKSNSIVIIEVGIALIVCSLLAMYCGAKSGKYAAKASSGFCEKLEKKNI